MGGSMTADSSAICGPVAARSEDMPDVSSKGLLPQLIDVLHALTEGQKLLSLKVRDARLGRSVHVIPITEGRRQTAHSDLAGLRPFVGTNQTAAIGTRQVQPPKVTAELSMGSTSTNGLGDGSLPDPIEASAAPMSMAVPVEAAPLPSPSEATVTDTSTGTDLLNETSARTDRLFDPVLPNGATGAPLNHDYNFFDELDSRLADLQIPTDQHDPGDRSEDSS
jgi:hypothetical protein